MCTAAVLQFKPRPQGFHLKPLPQVHFVFLFTRPLWLDFDKPYLINSITWKKKEKKSCWPKRDTQRCHQQRRLIESLSFCFCLHFILSVIHTHTHTPSASPSATLSPLQAPGLACILALGIHVSRPIDLLSFFKVRSWNLTQWGREGQNQPITYRLG